MSLWEFCQFSGARYKMFPLGYRQGFAQPKETWRGLPRGSNCFADMLSITYPDPDHSDHEERFVMIGLSKRNRLLIVAHTDHEGLTRIISARGVTKKERELYENK